MASFFGVDDDLGTALLMRQTIELKAKIDECISVKSDSLSVINEAALTADKVVTELSALSMNVSVLEKTLIGISVSRLKKYFKGYPVAVHSRALVKRWKSLLHNELTVDTSDVHDDISKSKNESNCAKVQSVHHSNNNESIISSIDEALGTSSSAAMSTHSPTVYQPIQGRFSHVSSSPLKSTRRHKDSENAKVQAGNSGSSNYNSVRIDGVDHTARKRGGMSSMGSSRRAPAVIPKLQDLVVRYLGENIGRLDSYGDVPHRLLLPLFQKCTGSQLRRLELHNPGLSGEAFMKNVWRELCIAVVGRVTVNGLGDSTDWRSLWRSHERERKVKLDAAKNRLRANYKKEEAVQKQLTTKITSKPPPSKGHRNGKSGKITNGSSGKKTLRQIIRKLGSSR